MRIIEASCGDPIGYFLSNLLVINRFVFLVKIGRFGFEVGRQNDQKGDPNDLKEGIYLLYLT